MGFPDGFLGKSLTQTFAHEFVHLAAGIQRANGGDENGHVSYPHDLMNAAADTNVYCRMSRNYWGVPDQRQDDLRKSMFFMAPGEIEKQILDAGQRAADQGFTPGGRMTGSFPTLDLINGLATSNQWMSEWNDLVVGWSDRHGKAFFCGGYAYDLYKKAGGESILGIPLQDTPMFGPFTQNFTYGQIVGDGRYMTAKDLSGNVISQIDCSRTVPDFYQC